MDAHVHSSRIPAPSSQAFGDGHRPIKSAQRWGTEAPLKAELPFDVDRFLLSAGDTISAKFKKSECIFAQGDSADSIYFIRGGNIKLVVVSNKGKEATLGVIGAGDYCGEGCLIDEPVRQLTATAMTSGGLLRISKKSFAKSLRDSLELSYTFTKFLVARSLRAQQDLIGQRFHSSEYRLARLLLTLSASPEEPCGKRELARISQETLASMVGTTRSRISFFLNKFKKAGLIEYSGGIRINGALEEMFRR